MDVVLCRWVSNVAACRLVSVDVAGCRWMSLGVSVCRCMSLYVAAYRWMSLHVAACRWMSLQVAGCRCMSLYADACRCMSLYAAVRRYKSLRVVLVILPVPLSISIPARIGLEKRPPPKSGLQPHNCITPVRFYFLYRVAVWTLECRRVGLAAHNRPSSHRCLLGPGRTSEVLGGYMDLIAGQKRIQTEQGRPRASPNL